MINKIQIVNNKFEFSYSAKMCLLFPHVVADF